MIKRVLITAVVSAALSVGFATAMPMHFHGHHVVADTSGPDMHFHG